MFSDVVGLFFGCTMLTVSLALLMTVVVTNIYNRKDTFATPPRWLVRRARRWDPMFMKNFPVAEQTTSTSTKNASAVLRNRRPSMSMSRTPPEMSPQPPHHPDSYGEADSSPAAARDLRIRMLCCTSRGKRKSAAGDMRNAGDIVNAVGGRLDNTTASRHQRQERFTCTLQPSFDSERNSTEWQLITNYLDRHLLYLYAVISISTQLVLLYGMLGPHTDVDQ